MTLKEWMKINRYTNKELSKVTGYTKEWISNILHGDKPGKGFIASITMLTNGQVTFEEVGK